MVLKSDDPINFLGTVGKDTGSVSDRNHALFAKSVKGMMLVFPSGAGSSVGAYTIYAIKSNGVAPLAMICRKADIAVATGCALANIPLVTITGEEFDSIKDGAPMTLDTDLPDPLTPGQVAASVRTVHARLRPYPGVKNLSFGVKIVTVNVNLVLNRTEWQLTLANPQISIILPTYNESQNIIGMLKSIDENIPKEILSETIIVDDNSPDGTGRLAEEYMIGLKKMAKNTIKVIHRKTKESLSSAILHGIEKARGETIVVMDSDFSHPPQIIPKLIEALRQYQCDLVVASRYITGGNIEGWPIKRKIMSRVATLIAKRGAGSKAQGSDVRLFCIQEDHCQGTEL